jgi:hypothetical protein
MFTGLVLTRLYVLLNASPLLPASRLFPAHSRDIAPLVVFLHISILEISLELSKETYMAQPLHMTLVGSCLLLIDA